MMKKGDIMIKCEKDNNSFKIRNLANKLTLFIKKDEWQNINIELINESKEFNPNYFRYAYDFLISQKNNNDVFQQLNALYDAFMKNVEINPRRYKVKIDDEPNYYYLVRKVSGNKIELLYPSDKGSINYVPSLGLIKYDDDNFIIIRFHRSLNKLNENNIIYNNHGSRFPELYDLYNKLFENLINENQKEPCKQKQYYLEYKR